MRQKKLTAVLMSIVLTAGCFGISGTALGEKPVQLQEMCAFLQGDGSVSARDYNGDGKTNAIDLAMMRQLVHSETEPLEDGYTGMIHAEGTKLLDETGKAYLIRGMAFGNDVWSNPDTPPWNEHHTTESYRELSEMGFNTVRFYLNYGLFESDSDPYTYRESGFAWLDQNIACAKRAGIRLVLNMHYPQGGYQSQGNGTALWTESENQKRLCALWEEIARRYADEPTILGYGLVNEPVVAAEDGEASLVLWQEIAQTITDRIRSVDANHIIFMERMCASQSLDGTAEQWVNFNDENNYVLLNDSNVVYEFHDYDPHAYTHQGFDWAGTGGNDLTYPDENYCVAGGNVQWAAATFAGDTVDLEDDTWQYLQSSFISPKTDGTQMISLVFQAQDLGTNGVAMADELRLEEYDADGNLVQVLYANDFDTVNTLGFWSNDDSGSAAHTYRDGHLRSGCLEIRGTTDDANCGTSYFRPTEGHKYRASGYFKVSGTETGAVVRPRVDVWNVDSVEVLNREYLEKSIAVNIAFSKKYQVPIYCGEFGAGSHCFENDRGGDRWVSDVMDIFREADVNFNYHAYHDGSFGLYTIGGLPEPAYRNETLYQVLYQALEPYRVEE